LIFSKADTIIVDPVDAEVTHKSTDLAAGQKTQQSLILPFELITPATIGRFAASH